MWEKREKRGVEGAGLYERNSITGNLSHVVRRFQARGSAQRNRIRGLASKTEKKHRIHLCGPKFKF